MENYNDLISAIVLGLLLVAVLIPLIGFYKYTQKERKRLEDIKSAQNAEAAQKGFQLH